MHGFVDECLIASFDIALTRTLRAVYCAKIVEPLNKTSILSCVCIVLVIAAGCQVGLDRKGSSNP